MGGMRTTSTASVIASRFPQRKPCSAPEAVTVKLGPYSDQPSSNIVETTTHGVGIVPPATPAAARIHQRAISPQMPTAPPNHVGRFNRIRRGTDGCAAA